MHENKRLQKELRLIRLTNEPDKLPFLYADWRTEDKTAGGWS
jgi:hypothetical protein